MKAISLWQPWASLIAIGAKQIETRSWRTSYTGPLVIHAARKWDLRNRPFASQPPFKQALSAAGYLTSAAPAKRCQSGQIPLGAIVAVCRLVGCVEIGPPSSVFFMEMSSEDPLSNYRIGTNIPPDEPERSFGNYAPGRFAWLLANVRPLPRPIPYLGSQGFFEVPDALIEHALEKAVAHA